MRRWVLVSMVTLVVLPEAEAAGPVRDAKDEARYEQALAAVDPALGATFRAATAAMDADRFAEARAGFKQVLDRVPRHGPSLRRLARVASLEKQPAEAVSLARQAVAVDNAPESRLALALVLAATGDPGVKAESRRLADETYRDKPDQHAAGLRAQFALEDQDTLALAAAVADLRRHAPDGVAANWFGALLSLLRNEAHEADRQLARAVEAGLPAAVAEEVRQKSGLGRQLRIWLYAQLAGLGFVLWLLGLLVLYLIGRVLSARTLRAIDTAAGDGEQLKRRTRRLRGIYVRTIAVAAAYYYLSIPFVIALVLVGAGGVIYGFLLIGWLPYYWLLMLVLGALFSVWTMLRSLLAARAPEEDPGRKLGEAEAPALWSTLREVAAKVGTRPVDSVYVTPGTELGVAERGPLRARLADRGHRYLVLGVGALAGFSPTALRAVLAHEYGHFSHRDTAGGGMAMAVMGAIARTVTALANRGGLLILNPAWHFLRGFAAVFMRITLGASRLQEVMADHFAALAYGPRAFAAGLTHIVRRSVEFGRESDYLITQAEKQRQPVANLYRLPADAQLLAADGAEAVAQAMAAKGSPYDSHPPPHQRIDWVSRLPEAGTEAGAERDAWSLFTDRAALESEMTTLVNDRLEQAGLIEEPEVPPFVPPAATAE